ncbi:NUDIX hydrolase [Asaia siamensis]|uniref:ADP-ribose pyrophosphatase YjhB n=1 Tax=Asaia siamensis TaxID=110479 RepID=A0ABQ1LLA1_9PROT|nr:NUDIX hydrolase [Asaia siamensis]GBR04850.1 phosphohydrolase [Asaia siamensis NRIC 0323]GGC25341.1 putative ADP-ribose pyrophosphatase YjhB [Asaia siamensis]
MSAPQWLVWARDVQAIAQNGLTFCQNPYDRERYEQLRLLSSNMLAALSSTTPEPILTLLENERGYATPKIDVRGAVFNEQGQILMVREAIDHDRWTLPGGWADVNLTTAQNTLKEVLEESGYTAEITKLAALWDRDRQGHPPDLFSCAKVFYLCRLTGGTPTIDNLETSGIGWFDRHDLPTDLSLGRLQPSQLARMFDHYDHPELATDYD